MNVEGFLLINIYALMLITTIGIVFFSKQRMNQFEDKIYGRFLIYSIMMNLFGIILGFLVDPKLNIPIMTQLVCNKIYLVFLLLWINTLTLYTFNVSRKRKDQKYLQIFKIFDIINIILAFLLPINIVMKNGSPVPDGIVYMYSYTFFCIEFLFQIICVVRHPKNARNKKFIPLYLLSTLGTATMINQIINPDMNYLINPVFIFIAIIMYFTIENPDMKVITELNKSKDILENNNEDRSNFMFRMTQEVRKPLNNIDKLTNMIDINDISTLEKIKNNIKQNTRHISYVVDNVLDVSSIDIKNIKVVKTTYNIRRLFQEINLLVNDEIKDKVQYHANISNDTPELLYGDGVKVKQIIMSILKNAIENTKTGFIEFNISSLIKYDMCRLIISVEDSGIGMDIKKVNDILTQDKELSADEINKIDSLDVDLNVIKKMINVIGGSMTIKSELSKGTKVIAVLNQKIADEEKSKSYKMSNDKKRVLLVDDDIELLKKEKNFLLSLGVECVTSMYGSDIVAKMRTGDDYDLIIIDDAMDKGNAVDVYDDLKNMKGFNIPTIVMLTDNKEAIKNHYLERGFKDYIIKSDLENEFNRIYELYLK